MTVICHTGLEVTNSLRVWVLLTILLTSQEVRLSGKGKKNYSLHCLQSSIVVFNAWCISGLHNYITTFIDQAVP